MASGNTFRGRSAETTTKKHPVAQGWWYYLRRDKKRKEKKKGGRWVFHRVGGYYSTDPAVGCCTSAPRLITLFRDTLLRSMEGPWFTPWILAGFIVVVETDTAGAATAGLPPIGRARDEATAGMAVA